MFMNLFQKITSLVGRVLIVLTLVAVLTMGYSKLAYADTEAYFAFSQPPGDPFVIKLTNPLEIQKARDILSGKETSETHVVGRIYKTKASYNSNWDFHLVPDTISFFSMAIEVCDANMRYVEDHLDEAGGAFLPGGFWCPWNSQLIKEVSSSGT